MDRLKDAIAQAAFEIRGFSKIDIVPVDRFAFLDKDHKSKCKKHRKQARGW